MGEVYRATDTNLDREVAIKVLPPAFTQDETRLDRFQREAKLLAQLHHPHIASIFGLEDADGVRALVMELVEGPTLAERLSGGPLSVDEALEIARQISEALEEAHAKGIIHRDLKPQNVKAPPQGKVKVLDFGLAKALDPTTSAGAESPIASPTLLNSPTLTAVPGTQLGVILGTAAYMAPEQARGQAVDKRADIWAFGVVLYEMLTGIRLFAAETVSDTLAGVLKTEIDLSKLPAETPAAIRRLLRRCLERKPGKRLRDIGDARLVLDEVLAGEVEEAATAEPARLAMWRRALPWAAGGLAGLLAGALLAPRPVDRPQRVDPSVATIRTLVAAGESWDPDVSPDGRTLAFASYRADEEKVWIKDLASGSESALTQRSSHWPRFSPDGTTILFSTDIEEDGARTDLYRVALATREERLVVRDADSGDWSPDGRRICFLRRLAIDLPAGRGYSDLMVRDLESGDEQVVFHDELGSMNLARWSPDGRRIAVLLYGFQTGSTNYVGLVDLETGGIERHALVLEGAEEIGSLYPLGLAWTTDRRLALLLRDGAVNASTIARTGRIATLDAETGVIESLLPLPAAGWGMDAAGDGSLIFGVGSLEQNLREARRTANGWSSATLLTEGPFSDRQPVYTPDGCCVLFSSDRSGNLDIWRLVRATGELRRLTDHEATDWDPALSPDGSLLLFSSDRTGRFQIWVAGVDGSSPRQVTYLENAQNPTMTADGEWIVFTRQDAEAEGHNGLWRIRLDGSELTPILSGGLLVPETSPDGRFVAFRGNQDLSKRLVRISDGHLLDGSLARTDRYRWSVEPRTFLWAIRLGLEGNSIVRFPFDPATEKMGPAETALGGEAARDAESLGVARDGSAFAFSSFANRRASILRVDGLEGLAASP